jgi:hypothetical protein
VAAGKRCTACMRQLARTVSLRPLRAVASDPLGEDVLLQVTDGRDRHGGAGGCGMLSSKSRRRAESPGTTGRKHDKIAVSQPFDTLSHAVI